MKDKVHNSGCEFAEGIVSYIYGEMPAAEQDQFEMHLSDCQLCIDEFALVSEARFAVYEWQRSEFAPLTTPKIRVPEAVGCGVSWFDKLRAGLWPVPAFAVAGLAVLLAVGFIIFRSTGLGDVPDIARDTSSTPASGSESTVPHLDLPAHKPDAPMTAGDRKSILASSEHKEAAAVEYGKPQHAVKVKSDLPVRRAVTAAHADPSTQTEAAASKPAKARTVPRMNDFSEEEDNSLRLAELFDDVDTLY